MTFVGAVALALIAGIEAVRAGRFAWVASLLVLAAVLNPILPHAQVLHPQDLR
jgi:hypothetical protein